MSGTQRTFSVGRDITAVAISPTGTKIDLSGMTEFAWKRNNTVVSHQPLNSPPQKRALPDGHDLTFSLDRMSGINDVLFSGIEQGFWAGGYPNGTSTGGQLYVYVSETDGSTSTYEGTGVTFWMEDGLGGTQKDAVKQKIMGFASTFYKVS